MSKDYTREELLYLSRLAEQCDRFDEMVDYVMQFAQQGEEELTEDERNILSVAFKNVVGSRRAAWRVISLIERKENKKGAAQNADKAKNYKKIIEKELTDQCRRIIDLLNDYLLVNCKSTEGQETVFSDLASLLEHRNDDGDDVRHQWLLDEVANLD